VHSIIDPVKAAPAMAACSEQPRDCASHHDIDAFPEGIYHLILRRNIRPTTLEPIETGCGAHASGGFGRLSPPPPPLVDSAQGSNALGFFLGGRVPPGVVTRRRMMQRRKIRRRNTRWLAPQAPEKVRQYVMRRGAAPNR
jgi:hypothetical protein